MNKKLNEIHTVLGRGGGVLYLQQNTTSNLAKYQLHVSSETTNFQEPKLD